MKATGIVRRVDELGRVVIPKEIRRSMHVREGDPLELFVDHNNNCVCLKKYSPLQDFSNFAKDYADVVFRSTGYSVIITDRDQIVDGAGFNRRYILDKPVSQEMEELMARHDSRISGGNCKPIPVTNDEKDPLGCVAQAIYPIVGDGEVYGTVVLFSPDPKSSITESVAKVAEVMAGLIGRQLEE